MGKTHLIIPDSHCHPMFDNKRADYLSRLIMDVRPDVVINIGDQWDMPSLSDYDKGKKSFQGRSYKADIASGLEFSDRLWGPVKRAKKKLPQRVFCLGNHEHRISKAVEMQPELLEGTISLRDLDLNYYYDDFVDYNGSTPGVINIDGILYAHFFISGVMGRSIGGDNTAVHLLNKHYTSATCGHNHTLDFSVRTNGNGKKIMGLSAGVFQDYDSSWAGERNRLWWRGVVVKRNVEDGQYDPEFISITSLEREYGRQ